MTLPRLALSFVVVAHLALADSPPHPLELRLQLTPGSGALKHIQLGAVDPASTLARAGLREGDVIDSVNDAAPTLEQLAVLALPKSVATKPYAVHYTRAGVGATVDLQGGQPAPSGPMRLVPAFRDGHAIGFKVFHRTPSGRDQAEGLHTGDILLAINGHSLRDPESAVAALDSVKPGQLADVDVERNDQQLTLKVDPSALLP
jgi:S1-C subfamily serine protease